MKLMTKEIEKKLEKYPMRSQDGLPAEEKDVICKFFHPWGNFTWYVLEGEKLDNGDYEFFGWVTGEFPEYGYFTLSDLESVRVMGLGVERDRYFRPCKLSEILSGEVY